MTLVVDASVLVQALMEKGPQGTWADRLLDSDDLAAPHHMPMEVANVLRRGVFSGAYQANEALDAYFDIPLLRVVLFPFEAFAERIWELRNTVAPHDAWYVALAESLDAPLATLDGRLMRSPGPRCQFLTFQPQGQT